MPSNVIKVSYSAAQIVIDPTGSLLDFFYLQIENIFLEIGKKGGYFGLGMGPYIGPR